MYTRTNNRDDKIGRYIVIQKKAEISQVLALFYPPRIEEGGKKVDDASLEDCLGYEASRKMFKSILEALWMHNIKPFTIIHESYNVNPVYRDSYYNYFAGQHFDSSRFAERLFFLAGDWDQAAEKTFVPGRKKELSDAFLGTCVIYPTEAQTIGRVLFKPKHVIETGCTAYVRLTDYSVSVLGVKIDFRAFPHQMQDKETTRCAEVTLLNLLDYYGNTYTEYRTYLPGEIVQLEKQFTMDRTLPSRGINYAIMSRMLTRCGFSPRLYNIRALFKDEEEEQPVREEAEELGNNEEIQKENEERRKELEAWQAEELRRIMHYYVESGIPVALNVADKEDQPGHSLICIGYQEKKEENIACEQLDSTGISLYNAADFYRKYIIIDDNQLPYSIRDYDNLSIHDGFKVINLLVPLYKRMYFEASDAYAVARYILEHENFGIVARYAAFSTLNNKEIVLRLFLASSRTYKNFRMENSADQDSQYRELYSMIPLPRFVWVAELFTKEKYLETDGKAFAEYVLDATASTKNDTKSIIMLNYPDSVSVRWPDKPISKLNEKFGKGLTLQPFPRFADNLAIVHGRKVR